MTEQIKPVGELCVEVIKLLSDIYVRGAKQTYQMYVTTLLFIDHKAILL